jgi:uncharacterized protein VirK/YbjX
MVARRSEIFAEWKVRFAISIASVAFEAFTKLLFCFSDVLKATYCTFQEVDNIFLLAVLQPMAWGTKISSEKEGLQQYEH